MVCGCVLFVRFCGVGRWCTWCVALRIQFRYRVVVAVVYTLESVYDRASAYEMRTDGNMICVCVGGFELVCDFRAAKLCVCVHICVDDSSNY